MSTTATHFAAFCASLTQSEDRWEGEPLMLELQADTIGVPVEAGGADATVAGAAAFAAVGAGVIESLEAAAELLPVDRRVEPKRADAWRAAERARWRAFVEAAVELR